MQNKVIPFHTQQCTNCKLILGVDRFDKNGKHNSHRNECRKCRNRKYAKRYGAPEMPLRAFRRTVERIAIKVAQGKTVRDITATYLRDMWYVQKGICALSGVQMVLPDGTSKVALYNSVSVDRIDPVKGYVRGNVRLICFCVNSFRGQMTDEQMMMVAKALVEYKKP